MIVAVVLVVLCAGKKQQRPPDELAPVEKQLDDYRERTSTVRMELNPLFAKRPPALQHTADGDVELIQHDKSVVLLC